MTTADLVRAARDVIPPAGASNPVATVEHTPGRTVYRAAWLVDGLRRSAPFGPAFERPRDLGRFLAVLTGGAG